MLLLPSPHIGGAGTNYKLGGLEQPHYGVELPKFVRRFMAS